MKHITRVWDTSTKYQTSPVGRVWYLVEVSQTSVICFTRVWFNIYHTFFSAECLFWGIILGFHWLCPYLAQCQECDMQYITLWHQIFFFLFFDCLGQNKHFWQIFWIFFSESVICNLSHTWYCANFAILHSQLLESVIIFHHTLRTKVSLKQR